MPMYIEMGMPVVDTGMYFTPRKDTAHLLELDPALVLSDGKGLYS